MPALSELAKARRKLVLKWRRFLGLCGDCGAEAYCNSKCDRCQAKATERLRKKRIKLKESNMCQECGKNEVNNGRYRCDACLELMRLRTGAGVCSTDGCSNTTDYNRNFCNECLDFKEAEKQSCRVYFIKCIVCDKLFTSNHKRQTCCCPVCKNAAAYYGRDVNIESRECKECNSIFFTYDKNILRVYCSKQCSDRAGSKQAKHIRRIRKRKAFIEVVNIGVLFKRDNMRCQLCGKKLNLKRCVPHPMAATIDHIIPLSKGGEHSYRNTQLACFMCNALKGDRPVEGGEQLLLFG